MNKPRLTVFFASVYITWSLLLIALVGMSGAAHADEPEKIIPVNLSVNISWNIDEGNKIRKGHFTMNAKTALTLDRPGSALDQNPALTPFSLKYDGITFTGSLHFEETLTQKEPQPPQCPPLLESYSGSRPFAYSPPKGKGGINSLLLRRWGIAKSRLKSQVSGVGAQQFLAQLQSQMGIPPSYYEFFGGSISGQHTIYGKKRAMVNGQCRYEKAETKVSMCKVGLRFPIPEQGPMEGEKTWRAELDTLPRNFAISLSQTGVGNEKPFRPENVGKGGNATYSITWNFKKISPDLRIRRLKDGQWVDVTGDTETVVVGEPIRLEAFAITDSGDVQQGQWSIPGKTVKHFIVMHEGKNISGKAIALGEEDLKDPEITFYWWDKSKKPLVVTNRTTVDGKQMTAETRFDVKEPDIRVRTEVPPGDWIIVNTPECDAQGENCTDYVNLVYHPRDAGKDFSIRFSHGPLPAQFPGETQYVQIVKVAHQREETGMGNCRDGSDLDGLDKSYPYARGPETADRPGVPMPFECLKRDEKGRCTEADTNVDSDYRVKSFTEMHFEMTLMFRPDKPQSIFVPLWVIDWSWIANLHRPTWDDPWNANDSCIKVIGNQEAEEFPEWDHVSPDEIPLKSCN